MKIILAITLFSLVVLTACDVVRDIQLQGPKVEKAE